MTAVLGDVCLGLGVAVALVCCLGLLRMRTPLDRLHFTAPAATLAAGLVAAAVLLDHPDLQAGLKAVGIAVLLTLGGTVTTHMLARAIRARDTGALVPQPDELRAEAEAR